MQTNSTAAAHSAVASPRPVSPRPAAVPGRPRHAAVPLTAELSTARVGRRVQLAVHLPHGQAGLGPTVNGAIARGLNILAHAALPDAGGTTWLLVVEQDWLAREVFEAAGLGYLAESVLLVEAAPRASASARLASSLAAAPFDLQYSYAMPVEDDRLVAVFKTADDERALGLLQASLCLNHSGAHPVVA